MQCDPALVGVQTPSFYLVFFADDWRCDRYRWVNQGVTKLPRKEPKVRKHYFDTDTPSGPSKEFQKLSYQLLEESNHTLIHVMKRKPMTLPMDVLQNTLKSHKYVHAHLQFEIYICKTEKASVVYKKEISSMQCDPVLVGVQTLRNMKQLCNLQVKHLQQSRIFQDALYSIQLAYIIPSYIWIITTFPDLVCIGGLHEILEELDRVLLLDPHSQLLSYNTTF